MMDVLIPLASQTNAIVFCSAVPAECFLSKSFTRMCSVERARWGGRMPFTIISTTNSVDILYQNPDETAHWRGLRRQSRAWRQHDAKLLEVFGGDRNSKA